jgi:hypothetical protein
MLQLLLMDAFEKSVLSEFLFPKELRLDAIMLNNPSYKISLGQGGF